MTFFKQTLKNTASLLLAVGIIGTAYAAITTVNSGDPLTASSWNEVVTRLTSNDTNSTDLVTKAYVDSSVSASSGGGYPLVNGVSNMSPNFLDYPNAISYCDSLIEGGYSTWRVPTIQEITLYTGTYTESTFIWTTSVDSNSYYRVIRLSNGYPYRYTTNDSTPKVRCVR